MSRLSDATWAGLFYAVAAMHMAAYHEKRTAVYESKIHSYTIPGNVNTSEADDAIWIIGGIALGTRYFSKSIGPRDK